MVIRRECMWILGVCFVLVTTFTLAFGERETQIKDYSSKCSSGKEVTEVYLTTGLDATDYAVIMVAERRPQCTFRFNIRNVIYDVILLHFEFPDWRPGPLDHCGNNSSLPIDDLYSYKYCGFRVQFKWRRHLRNICMCRYVRFKNQSTFTVIGHSEMIVELKRDINFTTIKMTATSMRAVNSSTIVRGETYCNSNEVLCYNDHVSYCMSSYVLCDGQPNCGSYTEYDEDVEICSDTMPLGFVPNSFFLALITIFVVVLSTFTLIRKRDSPFIFNVDYTVFDSDEKMKDLKLDVKVAKAREIYDISENSQTGVSGHIIHPGRSSYFYLRAPEKSLRNHGPKK